MNSFENNISFTVFMALMIPIRWKLQGELS